MFGGRGEVPVHDDDDDKNENDTDSKMITTTQLESFLLAALLS